MIRWGRLARAAAVLAAAVTLTGATVQVAAADPECRPIPVNPELAQAITLCEQPPTGPGSGVIALTNISDWALRVHEPQGLLLVVPRMNSTALSDSLVDSLMAGRAPDPRDGSELVGPGAVVLFGADLLAGVRVRADVTFTAGRMASDIFSTAIENRTQHRAQGVFDSAVECARSAGETWSTTSGQASLGEILPGAFDTVGTCRSMVKGLQELRSEPQPTSVLDELVAAAKGVGKQALKNPGRLAQLIAAIR